MLVEQIKEMVAGTQEQFGKMRWTFTLEGGRGQTYSSGDATLYAHSTYKRGSVMAGRPLRRFVEAWNTWEEAREALALVKKQVKRFKYEDFGPTGGSTHIDINTQTAGIQGDY